MIDAKAIHMGAPGPFLAFAMPCTPQIDEAGVLTKGLKKIGTIEARPCTFDIEIVPARVKISDYNEWHIRALLYQLDAYLKEGRLGQPLWKIAA